jgi:hypothetical protein
MECYCHFAANAHRIFKAKFDAAGRSADLVRVMGSQASYAGFPTAVDLQLRLRAPHHLRRAGDRDLRRLAPAQTASYATDATAAYDRLDVDGLIDVLGITELMAGREKEFAGSIAPSWRAATASPGPRSGLLRGRQAVSYEGGSPRSSGGLGHRPAALSARPPGLPHPRMYRYELARLQNLEVNCGSPWPCATTPTRRTRRRRSCSGATGPSYNGPVGTGDPGENRNPWDALAHKAADRRGDADLAAALGTQPPAPTPTPPHADPDPDVTPAVLDTIGDRIAEAEAADAAGGRPWPTRPPRRRS